MATPFLVLSKNKSLLLKNYIFGETPQFLEAVHECFDVVALNDEYVELKFQNFEATVFYASEFDRIKGRLEGHILIDLKFKGPIPVSEIQLMFKDFVTKMKSYLFLITDDEQELILEGTTRRV